MSSLHSYFQEPTYKEPEYEAKYHCSFCQEGFEQGQKADEKEFCNDCVRFSNHVLWFTDNTNLSLACIDYLISNELKPIN